MTDNYKIIDRLREGGEAGDEELRRLIEECDEECLAYACRAARMVRDATLGRRVRLRGLVEVWSRCEGGCLYCGLRAENVELGRYEMTSDEIVETCAEGYRVGLRTFVLQGGQVRDRAEQVAEVVRRLKQSFPDVTVTLSLGEQSREVYALWREAGAGRYLLRHETASEQHYRMLHPERMDFHHRRECLGWLGELGYRVGAGMMVGSPWQSSDDLVADLRYLCELRPHMVGVGPFMPQSSTPLGCEARGSVERTLLMVALVRLMLPEAMVPATTALASAAVNGTLRGLDAGANVVMPNITPMRYRHQYAIYDHKKSSGEEALEGVKGLEAALRNAGYEVVYESEEYEQK